MELLHKAGETGYGGGAAIARHQLHDRLAAGIRKMIAKGELKPGDKIAEKRLCDHFQVSRTPLREAIKVLAFEGFLTLHPNRSATVRAYTLAEIAEAYPILAVMEALAGELACERMNGTEVTQIKCLHGEMTQYYQRRELDAYFTVNKKIHDAILAGARNSRLTGIYAPLSEQIRCPRAHGELAEENWAQAIREHESIIEALESRDGKRLAGILRDHLASKYRYLEAHAR
jgi:DNA-binding GntR family transcriptional regulator